MAADAGSAGVGRYGLDQNRNRRKSAWCAKRNGLPAMSGGGGNRTRVRGRTGQNLYKRSPPLDLARRPEADALPAGQPSFDVALWAIGSPSAPSPLVGAATRTTGPNPERRRYLTRLGGECEIVLRTCFVCRWFYEANRRPRLAALPENRPRRNQVAPVCRATL